LVKNSHPHSDPVEREAYSAGADRLAHLPLRWDATLAYTGGGGG
jgi:hypothetical protein